MIMNPRAIPVCMDALNSLEIPKAWFKGCREHELQYHLNRFVERTDYDNYISISDDTIPRQEALAEVLKHLEAEEVVTGWCNLKPGSPRGNVWFDWRKGNYSLFQLMRNRVTWPLCDLIRFNVFETIDDINRQGALFRTYFMGSCFTGMRRKMWLRFPFRTWHNPVLGDSHSSDYALCYDLHDAGVPMYCARDAFVYHLKSQANWIVGKVQKQIVLES